MQLVKEDNAKQLSALLPSLSSVNIHIDSLNRTMLYYACQKGAVESVKTLLQFGAKDDQLVQSPIAQYAIGIAAYYNHVSIVSLLAVSARMDALVDALHAAVRADRNGIVHYLISHYSGSYKQIEIEQALYLSTDLSLPAVTETLLNYCKDIGMPDGVKEGWLRCAVKKGLVNHVSNLISPATDTASIKQILLNLIYV